MQTYRYGIRSAMLVSSTTIATHRSGTFVSRTDKHTFEYITKASGLAIYSILRLTTDMSLAAPHSASPKKKNITTYQPPNTTT